MTTTSSDPYELFAPVYDYLLPDPAGMIAFYLRIAVEHLGAEVLEIGAGTGRLTLRLAKRGHAVTAADISPAMLKILEERAVGLPIRTIVADQRTLDLGRTFPLVFITGGTLQHCITGEDYVAALHSAGRHLAIGGTLAFDIATAPAELKPGPYEVRYPNTDTPAGTLESWDDCVFDPNTGVASGRSHFVMRDGPNVRFRTGYEFQNTYPTPDDLTGYMREAGLVTIAIRGDFTDGGVDANTRDVAVIGQRME